MENQEKIFRFLRSTPIPIATIEREADIPARTLNKALSNGSLIPQKHLNTLLEVIKRYGYSEEIKTKVISIVNNKGGVGKTTTVINLGKSLSVAGYKVLLVDMDAQGNLSQCFNIHIPEVQVIDSLLNKNVPLHIEEIAENLYISPSDFRLSFKETELINSVGADRRLNTVLNLYRGNFDFILIDCPPSTNIITTNSLVASDHCIIPIQPEASAYFGVENLLNRIKDIRDYANPNLNVLGVLFTLVQKNQTVHKQMMEVIKETLANYFIFDSIIELSTVIKQSQVAKEDLITYDSSSKSAIQYLELSKEVLEIV